MLSYSFALSALIRPSCSHQLRREADVYQVEQNPPQTGEQTLMKTSWRLLEIRLFPLTNLSESSKCESENVCFTVTEEKAPQKTDSYA